MDTVIKGFLGVFIFAMIVYLSAGLISAEMDTHAARSYMDSAKKEIAESNMSPTVITAVQEQAARNGYQMQITTYGDVLETDGVELKMTYHYKIPILTFRFYNSDYTPISPEKFNQTKWRNTGIYSIVSSDHRWIRRGIKGA